MDIERHTIHLALVTRRFLILASFLHVTTQCPYNYDKNVIDFSNQGLTYVNASIFIGCPGNASHLILSRNEITQLWNDSFMNGSVVKFYNLRHIDLSNNSISYLDETTFELLRYVETLNLSYNALTVLEDNIFYNKFFLRNVDISHNNIYEIESNVFKTHHTALRYVDVSYNALRAFEPWAYIPPYLLQFNVSHNEIFTFTNRMNWTYDLSEPFHANVDMRYNNLTHWNNSYFKNYNQKAGADFATDFVTFNMDIRNNPWFCDCNLHNFSYRFQNSFYKHADTKLLDVRCEGPPELKGKTIFDEVGLDQLICNLTGQEGCPSKCLCQDRPEESIIFVDCTNTGLSRLPFSLPDNKYNKSKLIFDHNAIKDFENRYYIPHITDLSIQNNGLQTISEDASAAFRDKVSHVNLQNNRLKTIPKIMQYRVDFENIDLVNNPLICSCDMVWMSSWIKLSPVDDDDRDITCTYDDTDSYKIVDVTKSLLRCNYDVEIGLAIGFGALLVVVIIIVVWAKRCPYETKVLVYKFFRCHPQDKYKVDEQETTEYDLYVSLDDTDIHIRQWVLRKLAKRLEENKPCYKVYVPVRDLTPGMDQADEIITNMEKSRRVVIILSEKYDENEWCRFECQRAEILEHNDGRIIFIKYHPEADTMIESEPWKSRVKGRKILSPGEKRSERRWFWDKLKYELPVP